MVTVPPKPPPMRVKTLSCTSCGAAIPIHALGQTVVVACSHCGTTMDATDDTLRVLQTFAKEHVKPWIPLGSTGKLKGESYRVIGLVRRQASIYVWDEYLLFHPTQGFRWLTEYYGHWNLLRVTKHKPTSGDATYAMHLGTRFKTFQDGKVKVTYVAGEFYWQVKVGDVTECRDYVAPPEILCMEMDGNEKIWARGEYLNPEVVKAAFKMTSVPERIGIAPNQPCPGAETSRHAREICSLFLPVLFAIQMISLFTAKHKELHSEWFNHVPRVREEAVTQKFEVKGRGNLVVKSYADVNNSWIALGITLVNHDTGKSYESSGEISYYSGTDSDGSWTEGSKREEVVFPAVDPGSYSLTIDSDAPRDEAFHVSVTRDVVYWGNFWLASLVMLAVPAVAWARHTRYEYRRWETSDYPWSAHWEES